MIDKLRQKENELRERIRKIKKQRVERETKRLAKLSKALIEGKIESAEYEIEELRAILETLTNFFESKIEETADQQTDMFA